MLTIIGQIWVFPHLLSDRSSNQDGLLTHIADMTLLLLEPDNKQIIIMYCESEINVKMILKINAHIIYNYSVMMYQVAHIITILVIQQWFTQF